MVSGNEIPIAPLATAGSLSMLTATGEVRPLEEMENEIIRFAISHYRGQMSEVARRLKIGRSTLYRKLDEAAANDPAEGGARRRGLSDTRDCGARLAKIVAGQDIGVPEPLNRGLAVTDKRRGAWQKRATRMQMGRLRSVCRELSRMALAA